MVITACFISSDISVFARPLTIAEQIENEVEEQEDMLSAAELYDWGNIGENLTWELT